MNSILLYSFLFLVVAIIYYVVIIRLYKKTTYYDITHKNYFDAVKDKGNYGEYLIYKRLRSFEKDGAKFLFNCYLPKDAGETTEVDVIMIHESGVYVFESKNYSGWIFGSEDQKTWTQTLPSGRKSVKEHFLNPIMQNKLHIKWLQNQIGTGAPIHSVIVFSERCTLKSVDVNSDDIKVIKRNIIKHTVLKIDKATKNRLTKDQIERFYSKLYPFTQVSEGVKKEHIKNIHKETKTHKKVKTPTTKTPAPISIINMVCPKCGGMLVLRETKRGKNAGKSFYGCSNFPKCRYVRK